MSDHTRILYSDADLMATIDGRIAQLEGEREANELQILETKADPHVGNDATEQFRKNVESLTARISALVERREQLQASIDAAAE